MVTFGTGRLRVHEDGHSNVVAATAPTGQRNQLLLVMIDGDIGKILGRLLHRELDLPGALVSIDGVQLQELDFVDVGEMISPPGVVPVVIKSLVFPTSTSVGKST